MEIVLVERSFDEPVQLDALQAAERGASWCLELHRVKFLHTYVSKDGKRMICVYEAPDAEAVRKANETSKIPFDRVYTVSKHAAT